MDGCWILIHSRGSREKSPPPRFGVCRSWLEPTFNILILISILLHLLFSSITSPIQPLKHRNTYPIYTLQSPITKMSVQEVSLKPFTDQKPGTYVFSCTATAFYAHSSGALAMLSGPKTDNETDQDFERRLPSSNNPTTASLSSQASSSPSPKAQRVASWS